MDNYLSQKIKRVSFLLMIMVVFLHSYNIDIKQGGKILYFEKGLNWFIQNFISNGLTRIAVPLFFIISGYLFVLDQKTAIGDFIVKIKKRFRTLIVPYLFWAFFGILFYFILQTLPQSQSFFTKKLIKDYSFLEWLNALFNEPIPYQLWFLKDLIVMVILSPVIYFLVKKAREAFLLIIFSFWIFSQDTIFLTSEALLFFSAGMYISIFKNKSQINSSNTLLFCLLWLLVLILKTTAGFLDYSNLIQMLLLKAAIIIGLVAFWKLYDKVSIKMDYGFFDKWIEFSFFLYLFHEPMLTIIKKGMFAALPKTPISYFIVYLLAPVIIISISILIASILKQKLFVIYKIITGNR